MRYLITISLFTLFLLVGPSSLYACTCSAPSQRSAYRDAKAVFIGEVVEVSENAPIPPKLKGMVFFGVKFRVQKSWKGVRGREVTILSDMGLLSCYHRTDKFHTGEKYLVYAYDKELADWGCARSISLEDASQEIRRLNNVWFRLFARMYPFPKL